ncbi:MAG: hypothetical protein ACTHOB_10405 [Ginsengibacter sp.]
MIKVIFNKKGKSVNNKTILKIINYWGGGFIMCLILIGIDLFFQYNQKGQKKISIQGIVFMDNKPKANVSVKALEVEKEVETNLFGKYVIQFYEIDTNNVYQIEFYEPESKIDTIIKLKNSKIKNNFNLYLFSTSKNKTLPQKKTPRDNTFQINPFGLQKLQDLLTKDGFLKTHNSPKYNIDIKYTGHIERVGKDLYRYNGGFVSIYVNGSECTIIEEIKLSSTFFGGNSLGFVNSEIKEEINQEVLRNALIVCQKIKECLN